MSRKLTTEEFIEKAKKVHGDRYDYSEVKYTNTKTKIKIICFTHSVFQQTPRNHLQGQGCPKCANNIPLTKEDFTKKARDIHGDKYDYSKVDYQNNHTKVEITCPVHGPFWQSPEKHINRKHGCQKCKAEKIGDYKRKPTEEFIKEAKNTHGDKYDYTKLIYINSSTKVKIICPKHGEFFQLPFNHIKGNACPTCSIINRIETKRKNNSFNTSIPEQNMKIILNNNFIKVHENYNKDPRYPFACDFYIPERDLFVELNLFKSHGGHWFNNKDSVDLSILKEWKYKDSDFYNKCIETWTERDVLKRKTAKKNNLNYVVLWNLEDIKEWVEAGFPIRKDWK